jgi:hypothetical protein
LLNGAERTIIAYKPSETRAISAKPISDKPARRENAVSPPQGVHQLPNFEGRFTASQAIFGGLGPAAVAIPAGDQSFLTAGVAGAGARISYAGIDVPATRNAPNTSPLPAGLDAFTGATSSEKETPSPALVIRTLGDIRSFAIAVGSEDVVGTAVAAGKLLVDTWELAPYMLLGPPSPPDPNSPDFPAPFPLPNFPNPYSGADPYSDALSPADLTAPAPDSNAQPAMPGPESSPGNPQSGPSTPGEGEEGGDASE